LIINPSPLDRLLSRLSTLSNQMSYLQRTPSFVGGHKIEGFSETRILITLFMWARHWTLS